MSIANKGLTLLKPLASSASSSSSSSSASLHFAKRASHELEIYCHGPFRACGKLQNKLVGVSRSKNLYISSSSPLVDLTRAPFCIGIMEQFVFQRIYTNMKQNPNDPNSSDDTTASSSSSTTVLASSSHTLAGESFLAKLLQWIHAWLQAAWRALIVASRSTEVILRLSPLTILAPLAVATQSPQLSEWSWRYTISAVQALGPVAIKFCQWVATRRDMFPPTLCDRLAILHDKGSPHSWEHTHKVLTEAYGDYESRGLLVDEVVGCGSAAQVYRGRLNGTDAKGNKTSRIVAIKVLHPDFTRNIERDLNLMEYVADFLHSLPSVTIKMVNLPRATQNFGMALRLQADLTNEANNLQQFRSNFYQGKREIEAKSSIRFPQPISGWSSQNALVEDFVHEATPIATFLQDSTPSGLELRRELAGPLLRAFLKMVFVSKKKKAQVSFFSLLVLLSIHL